MLGRLYKWVPWTVGSPSPAALPANDNGLVQAQMLGCEPGGTTVPSLASATRDYARAIADGTFVRRRPRDVALLSFAMGPDLWSWQYARRLTGQPPWRAALGLDERHERDRVGREMMQDVGTWERALTAYQADIDRARRNGMPAPAPFVLPVAVQGAIAARRQAAMERAARRRDRPGDGGSGPAPVPSDGLAHPPFPGKPV